MQALLIVDEIPGTNLYNATAPSGHVFVDRSAVEVQEIADTYGLLCVSRAEFERRVAQSEQLSKLTSQFTAAHYVVADLPEDEPPPAGVVTPSMIRDYLAAHGHPGCIVELEPGGLLYITPPEPQPWSIRETPSAPPR